MTAASIRRKGTGARALMRAVALAALFAAPVPAFAAAQIIHYDLTTTSVMRINLPVSQAVTVTISDAVGKIVSADPADRRRAADHRQIALSGRQGLRHHHRQSLHRRRRAGGPPRRRSGRRHRRHFALASSAALPNSNVKVSDRQRPRPASAAPSPMKSRCRRRIDIVTQYGSPAVINTMTLDGGRQVNLEVRILEAQRDAGRELGIQWRGNGPASPPASARPGDRPTMR